MDVIEVLKNCLHVFYLFPLLLVTCIQINVNISGIICGLHLVCSDNLTDQLYNQLNTRNINNGNYGKVNILVLSKLLVPDYYLNGPHKNTPITYILLDIKLLDPYSNDHEITVFTAYVAVWINRVNEGKLYGVGKNYIQLLPSKIFL